MKKEILIVILLWIIVCPTAVACDACGVSSNNIGIGLLTNYRSNFIGLSWQQSVFKNSSGKDSGLEDNFQIVTLSVRYHFTNKWKINLLLPYKYNVRNLNNSTTSIHGLSDVNITGNYTLLKEKPIFKKSMLYLEVGGGFRIPTGKYNADIVDTELPENFNLGLGSFGFIGNTNLVLTNNLTGIMWRNNFQYNLKTNSGYRFGEQINSQFLFFTEKKVGKTSIVPNLGISGEWTFTDHYSNGKAVHGTSGKGAFVNVGLQVKTKKWAVGTTYRFPFAQQYADGDVTAKAQLSCQLNFLF